MGGKLKYLLTSLFVLIAVVVIAIEVLGLHHQSLDP